MTISFRVFHYKLSLRTCYVPRPSQFILFDNSNHIYQTAIKFSLRLINPHAMKMQGGAGVLFHEFLISASDAGVCWASQSGTQSGPRTHVTLCRREFFFGPSARSNTDCQSPTGRPVTTATSNSRGSDEQHQSRSSSPFLSLPPQSVFFPER